MGFRGKSLVGVQGVRTILEFTCFTSFFYSFFIVSIYLSPQWRDKGEMRRSKLAQIIFPAIFTNCSWNTIIAPRHHRLARSEEILQINTAQIAGNGPSQDYISFNFLSSIFINCLWNTIIAPSHHQLAQSEEILQINAAQTVGNGPFHG